MLPVYISVGMFALNMVVKHFNKKKPDEDKTKELTQKVEELTKLLKDDKKLDN